jgi:hypothetical protein
MAMVISKQLRKNRVNKVDAAHMERKQVGAILSDYDGTLCPTTSVRDDNKNGVGGTRLQGLEQILFRISEQIPVCVISSKDFAFLHRKARFARILSCVLGTEIVVHKHHYEDKTENYDCIKCHHLIASSHSLMDNSKLLNNVVEILQNHNYKDIMIEKKYTSTREILIGLTIDYRHLYD